MAPSIGPAITGSGSGAERDHFGGRASKLSALLELDESGAALSLGARWDDWAPDLGERFATVTRVRRAAEIDAPGAALQLALVDGDELAALAPAARHAALAALMTRLDARGSLLLFSANRLAPRRIRRDPSWLLGRGVNGSRPVREMLARAGASRVEEFFPLPELWNAEEIVADPSTIALPSHASWFDRLVLASGLFPLMHDGFVHIASRAGGGTRRLRERLGAALGADTDSVMLERFDLRSRGALVLMVRCAGASTRVVCRVATSAVTDDRIRRNATVTTRVREWPGVSPELARFLPQAIGTMALPSGTAYLESLVPGIVAWKLAQPGEVERRLLGATHDFTRELGRTTVRETVMTDDALGELLDASAPLDPATDQRLAALQRALRARLAGRTAGIVLSHGDYGYGNVMANEDGTIAGVIDWDQGRDDLAGVDLVNFLVQRHSGMQATSPRHAFEALHGVLVRDGLSGVEPRLDYHVAVTRSFADPALVVAWSALRFVQRSAGYPALFDDFREEAHGLLEWATGLLA